MNELNTNQKKDNFKLNRSELSPKIIAILDKFKIDKTAYATLKEGYLKLAVHKILQDSLEHNSFCDYFKTPRRISDVLLKLYGINQRELQHEFEQFNLKGHRVYTDPYYQTLLLAYLIGLDQNDPELREYALVLISILIWNYYKLSYFKKGCDKEIARYALNYEIKGNNTFKKTGTPFNYILKLSIPQLEARYPQEIAAHPTEEKAGLRRIITTIRSRYNQLMKGMARSYYRAYEKGAKEGTSELYGSSYSDNNEMVEKNEHFTSIAERLSDKILKIASFKKDIISKDPIKDFLYKKFFISSTALQKLDKYFDDEENHDDIKYLIELLISGLKPKTEEDLCVFNMEVLANRITGAKKEEAFIKLKEFLNNVSNHVFGETGNTSTDYRNRKITLLAFLLYVKYLNCKNI